MKLRRVAISIAATTALALGGAVSAAAEHDQPELVPGNPKCEDLGFESIKKIEYEGDQPTSVDVDPDDYPGETIGAVIVKAGNAAYVYTTPPFEHLTGPEGKEISHIELCRGEEEEEPPGEEPPGEEPPGEEPPGEEPPGEEEPEKPVTVPTEVPAGYGDTGSGVAGTVGLLAAFAAALAAGGLLIRRRLLNEN